MALTGPNVNISSIAQTVTGGDDGVVAVTSLTSPSLTLTNSGVNTALTVKYSSYIEADLADAAGRGTRIKLRPSTLTQSTSTGVYLYNSKDNTNCGQGYFQADEFGGVGIGTSKLGTGTVPDLYLNSGGVTGVVVSSGDVLLGGNGGGGSAIATTATNGFAYIPKCAGIPTGVPAQIGRGLLPLVIDSTNSKMYFHNGTSWIALN